LDIHVCGSVLVETDEVAELRLQVLEAPRKNVVVVDILPAEGSSGLPNAK
jgi:hypothetical protein